MCDMWIDERSMESESDMKVLVACEFSGIVREAVNDPTLKGWGFLLFIIPILWLFYDVT